MSELPSKYKAYLKLKKRMAGYAGAFTKKLRQSLASRNNIAFGRLKNSVRTKVRNTSSPDHETTKERLEMMHG